jgi:polyhydroxyalkanoate synthesis regulator phasin
MSEEQAPRASIGEGVRAGIGILTAFKQALEETIDDAAARNDLRPERAREALTGALERAQGAFDGVRDRLDMVPRREFEALQAEVAELRRMVEALRPSAPSLSLPPPPAELP